LESLSGLEALTFGALQRRLIRFVNNRISNGDFSERGLARVLRVSQPHLHKVLKNERKLTPELADRLLTCFGMTVLDLLNPAEFASRLGATQVPLFEPAPPQPNIAAHIRILRSDPKTEIRRKGASRQSSTKFLGSTETA
jgi:transcriptional regulator with XRE-family HTH domain